jgi:hypothetical protein
MGQMEFFAMNVPDAPYWTPNLCFWVLSTISLLHELWCKLGRTVAITAQVCETKSRWNFSQWTHPIHPIRPQTHIFGRFRLFCYYTNLGAKRAKLVPLMHKFVEWSYVEIFRNERIVEWSYVEIFRNERTLSTPHWIPNSCFGGVLDRFVNARTSVQNGSN